MVRVLTAAVGLALAAPSLAQAPQHAPAAPPPAVPAAQPAGAPPPGAAAAPTSKGPRELEEAKKLGRQGLVKIAPKLGGSRAEKLAKDKGGVVVDRVLDLAAEQAGVKK